MHDPSKDFGYFYQTVMKNSWHVVALSLLLVVVVGFYRAMGLYTAQIVIFMKEKDPTGFAAFDRQIAIPGGLDWIMNSDKPWLISGPILTLTMGIILMYMARNNHKLADIAAFGLVDKEKVKAMGKRISWAYGASAFSFALAALSFLFDTSLTLSMYVGKSVWGLGDFLSFASAYAWVIFIGGLLLSLGFGFWWGKTVEYPRAIKV